MGSVIATCGHELTEAEGLGTTIAVAGYARDGSRSVDYLTVCDKCLAWHKEKNLILPMDSPQYIYVDGQR